MSKVEIINEIDVLESSLINLLVSKHLVLKTNIAFQFSDEVQREIVDTISRINAYYVLLNSK